MLCKCGGNHRTYGIRAECVGKKAWSMTWAFPIREGVGKREGYDKTSVSGDIRMTSEYPGCPYCGQRAVTLCDCGHISCSIVKNDIFTCEWCGAEGKIGEYTGEKISAQVDGM